MHRESAQPFELTPAQQLLYALPLLAIGLLFTAAELLPASVLSQFLNF